MDCHSPSAFSVHSVIFASDVVTASAVPVVVHAVRQTASLNFGSGFFSHPVPSERHITTKPSLEGCGVWGKADC